MGNAKLVLTSFPQFISGVLETCGSRIERSSESCNDDGGNGGDKTVVRLYIGKDTWDQSIGGAILCAVFFGMIAYLYVCGNKS